MTKLQWIRTLYNSGLVLQLGHRTYGLYPLRCLGRLIIKRSWYPVMNLLEDMLKIAEKLKSASPNRNK